MNFREDIPGSRTHNWQILPFCQMQFSNLRYSKLLVSNCIQLQNKTIYSRLQNCMGTELFIVSCKQNTFGSPTLPCQLDHGSTGIFLWNFWGYLRVASQEVVTDSLLQVLEMLLKNHMPYGEMISIQITWRKAKGFYIAFGISTIHFIAMWFTNYLVHGWF